MSRDSSDQRDKDKQRTRLNAELAHNYGMPRKRGAAPGRNALTTEDGLVDAVEPQVEEEQEAAAEHDEQQVAEAEPKKSLFELPRKEPSRQPLLASPFSPQPPAAPAPAPAPAASSDNSSDSRTSGGTRPMDKPKR